LAAGRRGNADLCAYFFLRAATLLGNRGRFGFLATNTIAQGDTREVGLERLLFDGFAIPKANQSQKWPGTANLAVSHVWVQRGNWAGQVVLDEKPVAAIDSFLSDSGTLLAKPKRLSANIGRSFAGNKVYGEGFVLKPNQALSLITMDTRC